MNELIDFFRLLALVILGTCAVHYTAHATEWFKVERKSKVKALPDEAGVQPEQNGPASSVLDDSEPQRFSYQMPVMYRPRYYYSEPSFSQRFFGSSCPNCR